MLGYSVTAARRVLLAFVLALAPAGARADEGACGKPLVIHADDNMAPYSVRGGTGAMSGLDVTFVKTVLARAGCKGTFIFTSWKRALHDLTDGHMDMVPFASHTKAREAYAYFSLPYRMEMVGLILRRGEDARYPVKSVEDFARLKMRVGYERGTFRGDAFEAFRKTPQAASVVYETKGTLQGLRMLVAGRLDAVIEDPVVALAMAKELRIVDKIDVAPFHLIEDPVHFMFSRKTVSPAVVARIDQAIAALRQTRFYRDLYGPAALPAP